MNYVRDMEKSFWNIFYSNNNNQQARKIYGTVNEFNFIWHYRYAKIKAITSFTRICILYKTLLLKYKHLKNVIKLARQKNFIKTLATALDSCESHKTYSVQYNTNLLCSQILSYMPKEKKLAI